MNEAERQQRLLASLLAAHADIASLDTRGSSARALRGLQAYRANADASAARALATAFATVQSLIGDDDFAQRASRQRAARRDARAGQCQLRAVVRLDNAGDDFDEGRLARPILAEDRVN